MKIDVETKFNVGDVVYVAEHYYEFYANKRPHTIKNIFVKATPWHTRILYEVECEGVIEHISEVCVFATYEECTKWCKENN